MAHQSENPIYAHNTLEAVAACARYCALMEQTEMLSEHELTEALLGLLPLLYAKLRLLPEVDSDGAFVPEGGVTEEDYDFVRSSLYGLLHEHDEYLLPTDGEALQTDEYRWCSLSEGLADIYQSLRNFVSVYQQRLEPCMTDALWQLREDFELYLGQTMLNALGRLHRIRYSLSDNADEEDI